jgi:hypothetical protein
LFLKNGTKFLHLSLSRRLYHSVSSCFENKERNISLLMEIKNGLLDSNEISVQRRHYIIIIKSDSFENRLVISKRNTILSFQP